jgi:predicted metalloendopeptidase
MKLRTFYQDLNKSWLAKHSIPTDSDSTSVFELLEESVRETCIRCIREERHRGTRFGDFIESTYTGRANDLAFITDLLDRECASWTTMSDCFRTIGRLNTFALRTPLTVGTTFDIYNNDHFNLVLSDPNLGIMKGEFEEQGPVYKAYEVYVRRFFAATRFGGRAAQRFLELETAIAETCWEPKDEDSTEITYNPHNLPLLQARYPAIDFGALFAAYGVPESTSASATIIVSNPQFMALINSWVERKTLAEWAFIVKSMALISLAGILPEPFETIHFEFFNRFLSGQKKPYHVDRRVFTVCDDLCPDLLGRLYIATAPADFKRIRNSAGELCRTIIAATKRRVDKLNWISDGSKAVAKDKIDNMGLKIAYPDVWHNELEGVAVDRSCFLMNLLMVRKQQTAIENRFLNGISSRERGKWANPCYAVNAYYFTEMNELCIPLGFLQPPFFSLQASYVKNLAGLGNIVGHEISHGFDEEGHKYDRKGNFYPWWTSMDVEMYKNRTRQLIDAYDKESYFGIPIDGELTLGENLADFGAVAIGIDIVKRRGGRPEELREYFIEYAKSWAAKEHAAKRERDVKTDVHPPAQLRVNVVLKHFDAFYEAFGFRSTEPGFVPPQERIDVWGR